MCSFLPGSLMVAHTLSGCIVVAKLGSAAGWPDISSCCRYGAESIIQSILHRYGEQYNLQKVESTNLLQPRTRLCGSPVEVARAGVLPCCVPQSMAHTTLVWPVLTVFLCFYSNHKGMELRSGVLRNSRMH